MGMEWKTPGISRALEASRQRTKRTGLENTGNPDDRSTRRKNGILPQPRSTANENVDQMDEPFSLPKRRVIRKKTFDHSTAR
jgi:hypothetical protein